MRAERGFWLADQLARLLVLGTIAGVGVYLAYDHLVAPADPQTELSRANPGWTIEKPRHMGLSLVEGSGPELFINADDAGPLRLQRLDCSQMTSALPAWLRLPPGRTVGCLQMGAAAPFVQVLNHRTDMPITELWTRHFEPHLDELQLPYWGGSTGGGVDGPASSTPGRKYRSMSYSVDPASDGDGLQVGLMAFYLRNETVLVVTLRPPTGPKPYEPATSAPSHE